MYRSIRYLFVVAIAANLSLIAGCTQQQEAPSVRRSRAIAAENIELKKEIEQLNRQIEELRAQHLKESEKLKSQLQECIEEKDTWKTKAQRDIRDQVNSVLDSVVDDNARLRQENENLKKQIEKLTVDNPKQ